MNPFNFFNKGKQNTSDNQSGGSQVSNMVKGLFKNKLLVSCLIGAGGLLFFLLAIICIVIVPIIAIDSGIKGIQKTLDDAGNSVGSFFESLGNLFTTGYWGTGEEVFYRVVGDKYEHYMSKGIQIDVPLVLSAVFVGNTAMMNTNNECTIIEPEQSEESSDTPPEIQYDCGDEQTQQSYNDLRKEAIKLMDGMVDGNSVKSEEQYRQWLYDNFIEDKLKAMGTRIPSDEKERDELFNDLIDQIYFNRDMYEAALNNFQDSDSGGPGICSFNINSSAGLQTVSNVKVRLLGCTASGGSSGPLEGEELVDLEKYILGVTYTENGGAPDEAIKMQAIAARSFALTRSYGGKITTEDGASVIQIRACTWDQAYCDPDKGCWSNGAGGEYGNTIHSGYDASKPWSKPALPENDRIRALVAETAGQVVVDKDGNVLNTPYMSNVQQQWNAMANQGKSVAEMVKKTYPNAVEVTSNCTGGGNGSLEGGPDFSNAMAWKSPNNEYAAQGLYGQCTWFAWGRFYEIYGYSPGFRADGGGWVSKLVHIHKDKFEESDTPKVGAIFSAKNPAPWGHVGIVVGVNGDQITIQEGNLDGVTNSFEAATKDWHTVTYSLSTLRTIYSELTFANPKNPPK